MRSTCNRSSGQKFGSHRSSDEVHLQLEKKSGSRGSPDGVFPQLESETRSGSRRSPGEVFLAGGTQLP